MEEIEPRPTIYSRRPPERGQCAPITASEARRALGYERLGHVTLVDRHLEPFRYYGLRDRPFRGQPVAILTFTKDIEYDGPGAYPDRRPSLHVFQVADGILSPVDRAELSKEVLDDVVKRCEARAALPSTAKFQRSAVLYTLDESMAALELEGGSR